MEYNLIQRFRSDLNKLINKYISIYLKGQEKTFSKQFIDPNIAFPDYEEFCEILDFIKEQNAAVVYPPYKYQKKVEDVLLLLQKVVLLLDADLLQLNYCIYLTNIISFKGNLNQLIYELIARRIESDSYEHIFINFEKESISIVLDYFKPEKLGKVFSGLDLFLISVLLYRFDIPDRNYEEFISAIINKSFSPLLIKLATLTLNDLKIADISFMLKETEPSLEIPETVPLHDPLPRFRVDPKSLTKEELSFIRAQMLDILQSITNEGIFFLDNYSHLLSYLSHYKDAFTVAESNQITLLALKGLQEDEQYMDLFCARQFIEKQVLKSFLEAIDDDGVLQSFDSSYIVILRKCGFSLDYIQMMEEKAKKVENQESFTQIQTVRHEKEEKYIAHYYDGKNLLRPIDDVDYLRHCLCILDYSEEEILAILSLPLQKEEVSKEVEKDPIALEISHFLCEFPLKEESLLRGILHSGYEEAKQILFSMGRNDLLISLQVLQLESLLKDYHAIVSLLNEATDEDLNFEKTRILEEMNVLFSLIKENNELVEKEDEVQKPLLFIGNPSKNVVLKDIMSLDKGAYPFIEAGLEEIQKGVIAKDRKICVPNAFFKKAGNVAIYYFLIGDIKVVAKCIFYGANGLPLFIQFSESNTCLKGLGELRRALDDDAKMAELVIKSEEMHGQINAELAKKPARLLKENNVC